MSVRIWVYGRTDEKIEEMSGQLGINKAQVVEVAVNLYYYQADMVKRRERRGG